MRIALDGSRRLILLLVSVVLSGCVFDTSGFPAPTEAFRNLATLVVGEPGPLVPVLEETEKIVVKRGSTCAVSRKPTRQTPIMVKASLSLPGYDHATVVQSGWKLSFLSGDHQIQGVASAIIDVAFAAGVLSWDAAGGISDRNLDDPYRWCYYYTVIGWNSAYIDASVAEVAPISPSPRSGTTA